MTRAFAMLLAVSALAFGLELKYDDESFSSYSGEVQFQGVWFDVEDFAPGYDTFELDRVDIWFGGTGWGTDSTYIVIRECDPSTGIPLPGVPLAQTWLIANPEGSATSWSFGPALQVPACFVVLQYDMDQEVAEPRIGDDGSNEAPYNHSVYRQWGEGWMYEQNDYGIRCYGEATVGLESTTWASIKTMP
jgi:hypothetical protein